MKTYDLQVPFPEVMEQDDYDSLHAQKFFWEHFNTEEYNSKCDIVDNLFDLLMKKEVKEIFISHKDIPQYLHLNYLKTKIQLLESMYKVKFIYSKSKADFGINIQVLEGNDE